MIAIDFESDRLLPKITVTGMNVEDGRILTIDGARYIVAGKPPREELRRWIRELELKKAKKKRRKQRKLAKKAKRK